MFGGACRLEALRRNGTKLQTYNAALLNEIGSLRRNTLSLLRYKKQYEAAAGQLEQLQRRVTEQKSSAEEASLRVAAANGRADRLEAEVGVATCP